MESKYTGNYAKAFLSDKKAIKESLENEMFDRLIPVEENEMVCIFSFKGNKLIYSKNYDKFLGIPEDEMNAIRLNNVFTDFYSKFVNEYHDRILLFLYNNNKNLESFSSHVITKLEGIDTPVMLIVKVYNTDEGGNLLSIIGRICIDDNLTTSDIIQYAVHGDFDKQFTNKINNDLDFDTCISLTNIRLIEGLEENKSLEEISKNLNIEVFQLKSNLEKLIKRFKLNNTLELIEFAKSRKIIPNQFDKYLNK